ncbi:MAG: hypothetical protein EZS28_055676 [Streblomastix strix]|uniref:Uncharacterized protein n=1 Tax=Streblomastix strix TaxID=222440 RepID=A0A5J4PWM8_9EUKA|nr:MAG: hypothetical protein EZS28_055676 [Streblomastix strix]
MQEEQIVHVIQNFMSDSLRIFVGTIASAYAKKIGECCVPNGIALYQYTFLIVSTTKYGLCGGYTIRS